MTPLEEIEQAIATIRTLRTLEGDPVLRNEALGPLYIARAVERLEATVRQIGVQFQEATGEGGIIMASVEEGSTRVEDAIRKGVLSMQGRERD